MPTMTPNGGTTSAIVYGPGSFTVTLDGTTNWVTAAFSTMALLGDFSNPAAFQFNAVGGPVFGALTFTGLSLNFAGFPDGTSGDFFMTLSPGTVTPSGVDFPIDIGLLRADPVPEPTTLSLVALGPGAQWLVRRLAKSKRTAVLQAACDPTFRLDVRNRW
jgi:hypothetical protein